MKQVTVNLKKESICHNPDNNAIYGNIFLEIGEIAYPNKEWNDYIVRLLTTWAYSLMNNKLGELYFFDGPYEIYFKKNKDKIFFSLESENEYSCLIKDFLQSILTCLMIVLEYIELNKLQIPDINRIMQCMDVIKGELQEISN